MIEAGKPARLGAIEGRKTRGGTTRRSKRSNNKGKEFRGDIWGLSKEPRDKFEKTS